MTVHSANSAPAREIAPRHAKSIRPVRFRKRLPLAEGSGGASRAHRPSRKPDAPCLGARRQLGRHWDRTQLTVPRCISLRADCFAFIGEDRRSHHARGAPCQIGAVIHAKFAQQARDVKLYSAHRDVQLRGDLFVFSIANHGLQNLLLPRTQLCVARRRPALREQLFRPRNQAFGEHSFHRRENRKVARFGSAGHALHRQKPSGAFNHIIEILIRRCPKLRHAGGSFAKYQRTRFLHLTYFCLRLPWKHGTFLHGLPSLASPGSGAGKVLVFHCSQCGVARTGRPIA
jgi:hypothetical protein